MNQLTLARVLGGIGSLIGITSAAGFFYSSFGIYKTDYSDIVSSWILLFSMAGGIILVLFAARSISNSVGDASIFRNLLVAAILVPVIILMNLPLGIWFAALPAAILAWRSYHSIARKLNSRLFSITGVLYLAGGVILSIGIFPSAFGLYMLSFSLILIAGIFQATAFFSISVPAITLSKIVKTVGVVVLLIAVTVTSVYVVEYLTAPAHKATVTGVELLSTLVGSEESVVRGAYLSAGIRNDGRVPFTVSSAYLNGTKLTVHNPGAVPPFGGDIIFNDRYASFTTSLQIVGGVPNSLIVHPGRMYQVTLTIAFQDGGRLNMTMNAIAKYQGYPTQ